MKSNLQTCLFIVVFLSGSIIADKFGGGAPPLNQYGASQSQYGNNGALSGYGQGGEDPLAALADAIPGIPGEDYPVYAEVPETSFVCDGQVDGGYYADPEAECQAFHICATDSAGGLAKYSFLCPNGTLFNQQYFICDWWFNFDCAQAEELYSRNEEIAAEQEAASGEDLDAYGSAPVGYGAPASNGYKTSAQKSSNRRGSSKPSSNGYGAPDSSSNKYGSPQKANSGYGAPKSNGFGGSKSSTSKYGAPNGNGQKATSNKYGAPNGNGQKATSNKYGAPNGNGQKAISNKYGSPESSSNGYGALKASFNGQKSASNKYGSPKQPSLNRYGASNPSSNGYGAPKQPFSNGYGAPKSSSNGYGTPSPYSSGYGSPKLSLNGYDSHADNAFSQSSLSQQYGSPASNQYDTHASGDYDALASDSYGVPPTDEYESTLPTYG